MLRLPSEIAGLDLPLVVSVSGGKDSTACMIALREAGLAFRAVFADTGWEAPETYVYLDTLRSIFGPIDVVRGPETLLERARRGGGFPLRAGRWCTDELKVKPLRSYHDKIGETVSVVGVRAQESESRRDLPEIEDSQWWGGWVWRPLIAWSELDVYEAHRRASVPLNPLYLRGHDRVGCYPCIHERKSGIALIAEYAPGRIDEIREAERDITRLRRDRNAETPGRYAHEVATFFQPRPSGTGVRDRAVGIDDVVAWSRTTAGGRQLPLLPDPPSGGCFRLGFCERPSGGGK